MWAWQITEGFGPLALVERALPEPGPGEVRVRMTAWSLNYRDALVAKGSYAPRQPLPLVPLSDGVGVVEALGAGVTRLKVGDRVAPTFAQRWLDGPPSLDGLRSTIGSPVDGVAAEAVVLPAEGLVAVPAHLSDVEAATLPCAAVTAWTALFEQGDVQPGQTVLVQGTGGVSMFALQLATAAGARVIATSSSDAKLARVRELGAWETINYADDPSWGKTARGLTGEGVDHVVEVGGAGTMEQSLIAVRPGGTVSVIGVLSGAGGELALRRVFMNAVRMQGIFVGSRGAFERMNRALEAHELHPVVDRVFDIRELPAAFEYVASGAHIGKVALRA